MPKQLNLSIPETLVSLEKMLRSISSPRLKSRVKMLILIKKKECIYLTDVAKKTKYDRDTIRLWLKKYKAKGLSGLLNIESGGNGKRIISKETHLKLEVKLRDPSSTITSYVELLDWVQNNCQPEIQYATLYYYCRRNFRSKLKVARKSHIKKDPMAEEVFKKTTSITTLYTKYTQR